MSSPCRCPPASTTCSAASWPRRSRRRRRRGSRWPRWRRRWRAPRAPGSAPATPRDPGRELRRLADALAAGGYEPRVVEGTLELRNCPFHRVAQEQTALVCGLNLEYVGGVCDGPGLQGVETALEPAPGRCCVRAADDRPRSGVSMSEALRRARRGRAARAVRRVSESGDGPATVRGWSYFFGEPDAGPRHRRPPQAVGRRARARGRAAARHRRGADARLDGRRGAGTDPDVRPGDVLEPQPPGVLGQGRDLRAPPVGQGGPARLRRRHPARQGRPGGAGLPHRRPHLLRRRRAAGRADG